MLVVGVLVGFSFDNGVLEVLAGVGLLLLFGYAFSWVFAFLGLSASSAESAQALGFIAVFPLTFASSAFVPDRLDAPLARGVRERQPHHHRGRRHPRPLDRRPGGKRRVAVWPCSGRSVF